MKEYFHGRFREQLYQLEYRRPNSIVAECMGDDGFVFFGGPDWKSVQTDLSLIPEVDREKFVLCLFMIVLTDQCLYTWYQDSYDTWRRLTRFPKFGWSGFGPHNENPFKILWAPERESVVDTDKMIKLLPDLIEFLIEETTRYIGDNLPGVDPLAYFDSIMNDSAYDFNEGIAVQSFKKEFALRASKGI